MSNATDRIRLEATWKAALAEEFEKGYMQRLRAFLQEERSAGKTIYPRGNNIFHALDLTPLPEVKVVVIGQDPYHGPGQAHGLCFSVRAGIDLPPSLVNVYREINEDLASSGNQLYDDKGCLIPWAKQGVLLLNAVLTVERARAGSHQGRGWETFTDRIVEVLNTERERVGVPVVGQLCAEEGRPSLTGRGTASWRRRTHRRCPRTGASSAAGTSLAPTPSSKPKARPPSTGSMWSEAALTATDRAETR